MDVVNLLNNISEGFGSLLQLSWLGQFINACKESYQVIYFKTSNLFCNENYTILQFETLKFL